MVKLRCLKAFSLLAGQGACACSAEIPCKTRIIRPVMELGRGDVIRHRTFVSQLGDRLTAARTMSRPMLVACMTAGAADGTVAYPGLVRRIAGAKHQDALASPI